MSSVCLLSGCWLWNICEHNDNDYHHQVPALHPPPRLPDTMLFSLDVEKLDPSQIFGNYWDPWPVAASDIITGEKKYNELKLNLHLLTNWSTKPFVFLDCKYFWSEVFNKPSHTTPTLRMWDVVIVMMIMICFSVSNSHHQTLDVGDNISHDMS